MWRTAKSSFSEDVNAVLTEVVVEGVEVSSGVEQWYDPGVGR